MQNTCLSTIQTKRTHKYTNTFKKRERNTTNRRRRIPPHTHTHTCTTGGAMCCGCVRVRDMRVCMCFFFVKELRATRRAAKWCRRTGTTVTRWMKPKRRIGISEKSSRSTSLSPSGTKKLVERKREDQPEFVWGLLAGVCVVLGSFVAVDEGVCVLDSVAI